MPKIEKPLETTNDQDRRALTFMYNFIDTIPNDNAKNALLSLQTVFNGFNLDELLTDATGRFVTLSVGGRGVLSRRMNITETPYQHGAREKGFTYDIREIPVKFLIEDKTSSGLRNRFNNLNAFLLGSKKRLEFTDEEAYFIATLQSADIPDEESNSLVGTLIFVCTDPAKRKNSKEINVTETDATHIISTQGETPWSINVVFNEASNKFEFTASSGLYLLLNYTFVAGDRLQIDYVGRKVFLNGNDLRSGVSMSSNYVLLQPGEITLKASHNCDLVYDERYY